MTYVKRSDICPMGYMQKVCTTVQEFVPPAGTLRMIIQPEGGNVRWRDDKVDPTSSTGMVVANGEIFELESTSQSIRCLGSAPGTLVNISYYGS
jgi:hypothetical protein